MIKRLLIQREDRVGNKTQGSVRASTIKGIPRNVGLINWSKKLNVIVRLRGLFWGF